MKRIVTVLGLGLALLAIVGSVDAGSRSSAGRGRSTARSSPARSMGSHQAHHHVKGTHQARGSHQHHGGHHHHRHVGSGSGGVVSPAGYDEEPAETFEVYYRSGIAQPWTLYGSYDDASGAATAMRSLQSQGYEGFMR
jgi:hypothetical protein